jgi:hypothetical protein
MKHIDIYSEPTTNSKASQNSTRQIFIQGTQRLAHSQQGNQPTANLPQGNSTKSSTQGNLRLVP